MHPLYQKAAGLTETIIAAAIEVHRDKGPGFIESIYEFPSSAPTPSLSPTGRPAIDP
jgi:hypothetical protein